MANPNKRVPRWRHPLVRVAFVVLATAVQVPPAGAQSAFLENAELLGRVRAEGTLGVIVELTAGFTPEGNLSSQGVAGQRQSIRQTQGRLLQALTNQHISSVTRYETIPLLAMVVDEPALRVLLAHPDVARIQEDLVMRLSLAETVPIIGADIAHANGFTGADQTIAILDTGVQGSHSFLANKVVEEACFSSNMGSLLSICPNGQEQDFSPGSGANCTVNRDCGHGTHVAGIAAGDGGPGFTGVARDASIIAIQVASVTSINGEPVFDADISIVTSDVAEALEHVLSLHGMYNIAAVNMSFGIATFTEDPCDLSPLKMPIDNLRSVGIVSIAATGNDFSDKMGWAPSCISTAVAVGATTNSDVVPSFSNSPDFVDLLAPGVSVTSSMPPGTGFACGSGNTFEACDGTSMAAPHVSGAWAVYKQKFPIATVDDVKAAFVDTGLPVSYPHPEVETKPRLRLDVALDPCSPPPSGDWVLTFDCLLQGVVTAPANVIVDNDATLTIDSGAFLNIDLTQFHLRVRQGSRVIVKSGAKID